MGTQNTNSFSDEIICPYCFKKAKVEKRTKISKCSSFDSYAKKYVCTVCNHTINRDYVEKNYTQLKKIGFVGYEGQGKSIFIKNLVEFLLNMTKTDSSEYNELSFSPMDEETLKLFYSDMSLVGNGRADRFSKFVFKLNYSSGIKEAVVCLYDTQGENFRDRIDIVKSAPYCGFCDVIYLVISIDDSGPIWHKIIKGLLDNYLTAANQIGEGVLQNQNLKVVLTKGDLIFNNDFVELPEILIDWINNKNSGNSQLGMISKEIEKFLINHECGAFCNLANRQFKSVNYYLLSNLNQKPISQENQKKVFELFCSSF